jgi:hypothetical protein
MGISARQSLVLAVLASRDFMALAPVQAQKLFFLLDKKIPEEIGGPQFHFAPYDYGPFDRAVYDELDALARQGLVVIERTPWADKRRYSVTAEGQKLGRDVLAKMTPRAQDFIGRTAEWVKATPFAKLVGAVYQEFPEMRVNSIFKDPD